MVSKSESVVYYSTALLTVLIFLTDANAIAIDYKKSTLPNVTRNLSLDILPYRTAKLALTGRNRTKLFKNQNQERLNFTLLDKPKSKLPSSKFEQRELLQLSSSGGENDVMNKSGADEDDQKTLSQQVADGKYALIQNIIFTEKPRRLGVISYDANPEVPKDSVNNLGGLDSNDIWLAENHLLVLAASPSNDLQTPWKPIDDYMAPSRPVKLPPNPKIPPPFPVQLHDNGPIEFIESNNTRQSVSPFNSLNSFLAPHIANASSQSYFPLSRGKLPELPFLPMQLPFKPPPLLPPFVKPPPGIEFLPSRLIGATNMSDIDEDDPSLYYPPPYDFVYAKDNTSRVPAGPLVPGIVLPPPPNFFSLLENSSAIPPTPNKIKLTKLKSGKQLEITTDKPVMPLPDTSTFNYNDIINEVIENKIKDSDIEITKMRDKEASQESWIPIPASKPFFITGEKTPLKSAILVTTDSFPATYFYDYKKATFFKTNAKKPTGKYLQYEEAPRESFHSTTSISPQQIVSTKLPSDNGVSTTTPISPPEQPNIKTSYYFYKEPLDDDIGLSKPSSTSAPSYVPSTIEIEDILPAKQIAPNPKPIPKNEKKRKPVAPLIPIYYLADLDDLTDSVKPTRQPYSPPSTPKTEYLATIAEPIHSFRQQPTSRPITEYSYVAANHNNHPSPISPHSTPAPQFFNHNGYYHQPPSPPAQYHDDIFNSIVQFSEPHRHTTAKPILYLRNHYSHEQNKPTYDSFDSPWLPNFNFYYQFAAAYPTENPYHAFFTKEEADLIDDNTKEYFTIFGKKIKQRIESTTPLSIQTSPTPATIFADRCKSKHQYGRIPTTTTGYISYSSTSPASFRAGYNTNKPLSSEGDDDIHFNYATPLPPVNPDTRTIAAATFPLSFIRPIVVDDLPADLHERLNSITNLQRVQSHQLNRQNYYAPIYQRYDKAGQTVDASTPVSLLNDIDANYRSNLATDLETEYVASGDSSIKYKQSDNSRENGKHPDRYRSQTAKPISLQNDILVNYKSRNRLGTNLEAENIGSGKQTAYQNVNYWADNNAPENIVSYKYPAVEHSHYYFLTPDETRYKNTEDERRDFPSFNAEKSGEYLKRKIIRKSSTSTTSVSSKWRLR